MKVYIVKKPTNREFLKREDLQQGIKHSRFDDKGFVLCSYDGCGRIHKDDYIIDRGEIFKSKCLVKSKNLSREIFGGMF